MALRSAGSPNGSQPILLSDSQRHRESVRQYRYKLNGVIGPIGIFMVFATLEAAVTFIMGFTFTKVYNSSAPDLGITGSVKKTIFMVFVFCNCIPMLASVVAVMLLILAKLSSGFMGTAMFFLQAVALVQIAFQSMLVAFIVGLCLVVILLPWHTYFT